MNADDIINGTADGQREEEWREVDCEPTVFDFLEAKDLKIHISSISTASEVFNLIFDNVLVDKICEWVILRARYIRGNPTTKFLSMNKLKDTSPEEFRRFLGLCLLMGNIGMTSVKNYWSQGPFDHHPIFGKNMSRNRFESIIRCLCLYKSDDDKTSRL